jgi:hypothetical protein
MLNFWRHDTQDTQHNDSQHNKTQHNDTQHKGLLCDSQHDAAIILCRDLL